MHLSACCKWAKKSGLLETNPFEGLASEVKVKKTGTVDEEIYPFTREERDLIIADGRKYGLALVLASQSERHLSLDVIGNSATKIVLPVDQTEAKKVARKFRFAEQKVAQLEPLTALCRFGTQAQQVEITPYYQRIQEGS